MNWTIEQASDRKVVGSGITYEVQFGDRRISYDVTVRPELTIVITANKAGAAVDLLARDIATLMSLCLRCGCSIETMVGALSREDEKGTPSTIAGAVADGLLQMPFSEFVARPRERLPQRRHCETTKIRHGAQRSAYHVTISRYPDGRIGEVFCSTNQVGTALDALARDSAILVSLIVQHGGSVAAIRNAMGRNEKGAPATVAGAIADIVYHEDTETRTSSRTSCP